MQNELTYKKFTDRALRTPRYSIPKTERFKEKSTILCDNIYKLPDTLDKHGTSLGYGSKSQLFLDTKTPGPGSYVTSKNFLLKNAIGMGLGREQIAQHRLYPKVESTIGPGDYSTNRSTLTSIKYSMQGRHEELKQLPVPGSGTYQHYPTITKNGKHFLSQFTSSQSAVFNPKTSQRFKENFKKDNSPGIGTYNVSVESGHKKGIYLISQYNSLQGQSFSHQKRKLIEVNSFSPGPGSYKIPCYFP